MKKIELYEWIVCAAIPGSLVFRTCSIPTIVRWHIEFESTKATSGAEPNRLLKTILSVQVYIYIIYSYCAYGKSSTKVIALQVLTYCIQRIRYEKILNYYLVAYNTDHGYSIILRDVKLIDHHWFYPEKCSIQELQIITHVTSYYCHVGTLVKNLSPWYGCRHS